MLARARKEALGEMEDEARKLGGNAVIGVDLDYEVLGSNGVRACGATREGGSWLYPEAHDGLDLGEDDFDYDDFVRREFGKDGRPAHWFARMTPKERFWWVVAVVLLVAIVSLILAGLW